MAGKLKALRIVVSALLIVLISTASHSQVLTYTESVNSATELAVGYPIPIPVDSLTAVAGFRRYDSLHAQHQDLMFNNAAVTGQVVGTTHLGREIWAYQIGDSDTVNINGTTEGAVLINGGIHAREWASPEVVTELYETLVEGSNDSGLVQYIIENMNVVLVPVNNVDGFIQTQTYPTQITPTPAGEVTTTQPPEFESPRDGRMRRKNMLGVDEDLTTAADRLFGVDLNRNNAVLFDDGANSTDPESIVYRGTAPASEPEIQALNQAATLAPEDRLRLYVDMHSFSRVFFIPTPPNARQNSNTALLANKLSNATSINPGHPAYFPVIGTVNVGISGTAEFFAYTYNVPAWTMELEPPQGFPGLPSAGAFYGGFGISHDGFILPDSEVTRVRDEVTVANILALYHQAGPPSAQAVEVRDAAGTVLYAAEWQSNNDGTRTLAVSQNSPLQADGSAYTMWLAFDKPMRSVSPAGGIVNYAGQNFIANQPVATLTSVVTAANQQVIQFPTTFSAQPWPLTAGGAPNGYRRYRTDAIVGTFTIPANAAIPNPATMSLDVLITDLAGHLNDGNPGTVVDFANGGWTNYENAAGAQGDVGGTDSSFLLTVNTPAVVTPPPAAGGGGGGSLSVFLLSVLAGFLALSSFSSCSTGSTSRAILWLTDRILPGIR